MVWPIIAGKPLLARHVRLCSKASQRGREWNEPWQTDEPIECVCWELFALLLGAPVDEVAGVEGDARKIGGDKSAFVRATTHKPHTHTIHSPAHTPPPSI